MRIESLQISEVLEIKSTGSGEWWDKDWSSGFFKKMVKGKQWLGYEGLRGDQQSDRKNHGGADKAICAYSLEHYDYWRELLGALPMGAFGENLTISGLLETEVCIGDIYHLGEALVQVSQPRQPCWKLARRWKVKSLTKQVEETGYTGFYFRVLEHGWIQQDDAFTLEEKGEWRVQKCNELMHHNRQNFDEIEQLVRVKELSANWKDTLFRRIK